MLEIIIGTRSGLTRPGPFSRSFLYSRSIACRLPTLASDRCSPPDTALPSLHHKTGIRNGLFRCRHHRILAETVPCVLPPWDPYNFFPSKFLPCCQMAFISRCVKMRFPKSCLFFRTAFQKFSSTEFPDRRYRAHSWLHNPSSHTCLTFFQLLLPIHMPPSTEIT